MKLCSICGARVEDSERYCPSCGGGELVPMAPTQQPQRPPQRPPQAPPQRGPAPGQRPPQAPPGQRPPQAPPGQRPQTQAHPQQRPPQAAPGQRPPQAAPGQRPPQAPPGQRPQPGQRPPQQQAPGQRPPQHQQMQQGMGYQQPQAPMDFEEGFTGAPQEQPTGRFGRKPKAPKPPKQPKQPKQPKPPRQQPPDGMGYDPAYGYSKTDQDLSLKDLLIFTLFCMIPIFGIYKIIVTAIGSPTIKPSLTTVARWNLIVGAATIVFIMLTFGSIMGILASLM